MIIWRDALAGIILAFSILKPTLTVPAMAGILLWAIFERRGYIIAGFAGSTADAITLFEKFEEKLNRYGGNLTRAAVELVKDWRTDRVLRRLEAMLLVVDQEQSLIISGNGDVIEPDGGAVAIGSGGAYALAAARALLQHSQLSAREIALESMMIASQICLYTNDQIVVEELG